MTATDEREIETERLTLRPPQLEDFASLCVLRRDPDAMRHIGGPQSPEDVWARLLRYAGTWALFGYGFWILRERHSGEFIGELGFINGRRTIKPDFGDRIELGYMLLPRMQRRGYAREAAQAVIAWSERMLGPRELVCMIDPQNQPSLRLAAVLGFEEYARVEYKGEPVILLARQPTKS